MESAQYHNHLNTDDKQLLPINKISKANISRGYRIVAAVFLLTVLVIAVDIFLYSNGISTLIRRKRSRSPFVNDGKFPISHYWRANELARNWTSTAHLYKHLDNIVLRADIAKLLEEKKFKVGAELGVQRALYSVSVLNTWKSCEKYILVDTWRKEPETSYYLDPANVNDNEQNEILIHATNNVRKFGNVPVIMRNMTTLAAALVPDNSIDFIYVSDGIYFHIFYY